MTLENQNSCESHYSNCWNKIVQVNNTGLLCVKSSMCPFIVDRHLCYFIFLAIMNKVSISSVVQTIVQKCNFISLGKIPRSEIGDHMESECLSVYDSNKLLHKLANSFWTTTKHVREFQLVHLLANTWDFRTLKI